MNKKQEAMAELALACDEDILMLLESWEKKEISVAMAYRSLLYRGLMFGFDCGVKPETLTSDCLNIISMAELIPVINSEPEKGNA